MEVKTEINSVISKKCPECGSVNLIYDHDNGEKFCGDCGLVLDQEMENKAKKGYSPEQTVARLQTGPRGSLTIHDKGLSTKVGNSGEGRDASNKRIPGKNLPGIKRIAKWQNRSRAYCSKDINLSKAMQEMDRICDKLFIPSNSPIREQAANFYRKALDKNIIRGRTINGIVAASVYHSLRINKIPKKLKEVADVSLVNKKDVARCYRFLYKELDAKLPVVNPELFISRIAEKIHISGASQNKARELIRRDLKFHQGSAPTGTAAATLYIACLLNKEQKTQKNIAEAAQITEVTLRNRYKKIQKKFNIKLPD